MKKTGNKVVKACISSPFKAYLRIRVLEYYRLCQEANESFAFRVMYQFEIFLFFAEKLVLQNHI
jgi:hypothetical protein